MALRLYSIDETCAGRFFQRLRQRPIFRAVGSADRSDPAQMIFRLLAVALLDLPQTVIVPGQHMVRIGFQRALVPDLRELVVAKFAIGIADQIGHVRVIVVAERLQLLDTGGIIVTIVYSCISCTITLAKCRVDAGLLAGLLDLVGGGFSARGLRVRRRRRRRAALLHDGTGITVSTATTAASSREGRGER